MSKVQRILRYELVSAVRSKSFVITTFLLPLLGVLIFLGVNLINQNESTRAAFTGGNEGTDALQLEGYVDYAGVIDSVSESVPPDTLVEFPDEASAKTAMEAGEIAAYYIIAEDYIASGNLTYVNPDYRLTDDNGQEWVMKSAIFANLLDHDVERIDRARNVMNVTWTSLSSELERDGSNPMTFFIPYITMMIFYMTILMSASLLLNSVNNEKKNRVLEVLLVSITPRQMLTGKIVALGILGLLQVAIWIGTSYSLLLVSGRSFSLPAGFIMPPSVLVWGLVFFLLGYAVYASLMAGLGALVPNMKEASQATFLVIFPLIIPLVLISVMIEAPHGVVSTVMSLFPLTAPIAMMTRLVSGGVPFWQPLLAAGLLVLTAIFIVRSVANMFRAQNMLSGQPFSAKRFYWALLGKS